MAMAANTNRARDERRESRVCGIGVGKMAWTRRRCGVSRGPRDRWLLGGRYGLNRVLCLGERKSWLATADAKQRRMGALGKMLNVCCQQTGTGPTSLPSQGLPGQGVRSSWTGGSTQEHHSPRQLQPEKRQWSNSEDQSTPQHRKYTIPQASRAS